MLYPSSKYHRSAVGLEQHESASVVAEMVVKCLLSVHENLKVPSRSRSLNNERYFLPTEGQSFGDWMRWLGQMSRMVTSSDDDPREFLYERIANQLPLGVGDAMRFHLDTNREEFREELNKRLSKHGITIIGDSKYYGYNAIM